MLQAWNDLFYEIQSAILKQLVLGIADAKIQKKRIPEDKAFEEAIEAASSHPRLHNFRVALNISIDSTGPVSNVASFLVWSLLGDQELDKHPRKAVSDAWENYKRHALRTHVGQTKAQK
jgi:hypothetical protein